MSTTRRTTPSIPDAPATLDGWVDRPVDATGAATRTQSGPGGQPAGPVIAVQSRHLVIRASAGSGKTHQLTLRYLRRLLDGVPPEQILASTFTRKAAGEILARILTRLAVASRNPVECTQLGEHVGIADLQAPRCLQVLKTLAQSLHRLRVGTLDSFFTRLATSYTLELGLPPGWQIVDELADARLRRKAIEAVLSSERTAEIRRLSNLLSKGDSGRRISSLIQSTVDQFYTVYRQTDAAAWQHEPEGRLLSAEELASALEELRSVELPDHKRVLSQRVSDLETAEAGDWQRFVSTGIASYLIQGQTTYHRREIPPAAQAVYQRLIGHARGIFVRQIADKTAATRDILAAFDAEYRRIKQQERCLRFDDVTERLAEALGTADDTSTALNHLAYRLDSDIAHLLLDEFQDTSLPQWQVVQPFARRITETDDGTSFFCVGDVKQAIYGWRGGVAEIFDAIGEQFDAVTSETLATSYRSSQVVIDVVNEIFGKLPRHANLKQDAETVGQWCAAVEPHTTALDIPGHVTLESSPRSDDLHGPDNWVIEYAADRVSQIVAAAPRASIGVLVRQNKYIAALVSELRQRSVDASEESGNPLTDSAAVVLMLSLLRIADHPGDTIARFHVANSPLGSALEFHQHDDVLRAGQLGAEVRRALIDDGYGPAIDAWSRHLVPFCSRRDVTRLGQLVNLAYRFQQQATLRPGDFIRFVEVERVQDPSSAKVRVMNVHQAKGLQFDVVVLPLLDARLVAVTPKYVTGGATPSTPPDLVCVYADEHQQRLLPPRFQQAFAQTRAAAVREELCVLYVALTRAEHALHIIVPPSTSKETRLPGNSAGLIRAALTDGQAAPPDTVLYERGERRWADAVDDWDSSATSASTSDESAHQPPLKISLATMTGGRNRGLGRIVPSQDGPVERVRLSQLVKGPESAALDRGTLIHAWFEQIEWLDERVPDEERLKRLARRQGFSSAQIDQHLVSFRSMLQRPTIAGLLSRHSYATLQEPPLPQPVLDELAAESFSLDVSRERPVAVRLEGDLLTGTIDRLVLLRRGWQIIAADIIDYKTDAVGAGDAADLDRTAHYRRQLQSYTAAVSRIYRLPVQRIAARLVFVETGQVISV